MMDICEYVGVATHNLKNINIGFRVGSIVLFNGPSGSGKSSAAVDTIHKISEDELFQLMNRRDESSHYSIREYKRILPSVCLQQENYNSNPRSIIATYFSLDGYFKRLFSQAHGVSQRIFQFNLPEFACPECRGLGTSLTPDTVKIVDYTVPLSAGPFACWKNIDSHFYAQSLALYCAENSIPMHCAFKDLTAQQQNGLLYATSEKPQKIRYVSNGRRRTRTACYVGPAQELLNQWRSGNLSASRRRFFAESTCLACGGKRLAPEVLRYEVFGHNLGSLYTLEADALAKWVRAYRGRWAKNADQKRCLEPILSFLNRMVALGLSYVNLGRSIPSLSGGELQRLRLAKAVESPFSRFLYVLDEPAAGLHPTEWKMIERVILNLKRRGQTVLLVDHSDRMGAISDKVFTFGPGGGSRGGRLEGSLLKLPELAAPRVFRTERYVRLASGSARNIVSLAAELPLQTLVGVCGVSGSGKSCFLREVLPTVLPHPIYMNQSPIGGNAYSIVATAVDVLGRIQELFARLTKSPKDLFTYSSAGKGQCLECAGKGVVSETLSLYRYAAVCPSCNGRRFSEAALRRKVFGVNIHEFLASDVETVLGMLPPSEYALANQLSLLKAVGLGYIALFQEVSSLSGGEAQRVKLVGALQKQGRHATFLLDEPFRGVDPCTAQCIIAMFYELIQKHNTIYVAEHDPFVLRYCSYLFEFGPGGGRDGGRLLFAGAIRDIARCSASRIREWLR